jgi:hypothetical protein
MPVQINDYVTELTYKEARDSIRAVNSGLADAIDQLDPSDEYKLLKVRYRYGDHILLDNQTYIPDTNGQLTPTNSPQLDPKIKKLFPNHKEMPVTLLLSNSAESFINIFGRPIPFSICQAGSLYALSAVMPAPGTPIDHPIHWNFTAGIRSIFMLPKIGEATSHNKILKELGINCAAPKELNEHFEVFRKIAIASNSTWHTEVIFFTEKWFEERESTPWIRFRHFLFEYIWPRFNYLRGHQFQNLILSTITAKLKPNPAFITTLNHIIDIIYGWKPGFTFAVEEQAAPVSLLEKTYSEIYDIKQYAPVLMHAANLSQPIYYSFNVPAELDFLPKNNKKSTKIDDLKKFMHLYNMTVRMLKKELSNFQRIEARYNFNEMIDSHQIQAFHYEKDPIYHIQSSTDIQHPNLNKIMAKYPNRKFPESASFFCGALEIKKH